MINSLVTLIFFCAFDIAAIVIGALYKLSDVYCVTPLIMFNGAIWLLAGGCVVLILKCLAFLPFMPLVREDGFNALRVSTYPSMVREAMILCGLFMFAWAVVGIVLLATAGTACQNSAAVFIMSIIYIIVLLLGISIKLYGGRRARVSL